jgi:hypothetical protein
MKKQKHKTVHINVYANGDVMRAGIFSEQPVSITILETKIEKQSNAGRKTAAKHLLDAIQETLSDQLIDHLVKLAEKDSRQQLNLG